MAHSTPQQSEKPSNDLGPSQPTEQNSPDILLIVFIHGFKGDETTFKDFPSRLQKTLSENSKDLVVESIISPAYDTSGELTKAVGDFTDWLVAETVQREIAHGVGSGSSRVKIVLCGHSMGGLLAADSIKEIIQSSGINNPLWPNVVACLGFDTPYLGLDPNATNGGISKAIAALQKVYKAARKLWGPASKIVYALVAAALAAIAYLRRADIEYVRVLWDTDALKERLRLLVEGEAKNGVFFRTFYTLIPESPPANPEPRRFCLLPEPSEAAFKYFVPARNTHAEDEVNAHVSMFKPADNDGYDQLERDTVAFIRQAITKGQ